jgi:hypothetical protein
MLRACGIVERGARAEVTPYLDAVPVFSSWRFSTAVAA